ncbi:MAG TPA: anthranilate synthase component I family protein, partial [Pyrodictium sp.]|nr:anthranilate synthase component I family protein [Pyrodictium sp.]
MGIGSLTPLLSWDDCEKHSMSTVPSPRRVVAWALERGEEYVALLESGEGLPGRARYTIVGLGAEDSIASDDILSVFSMLRRFLEKMECNTLPCRDMAIVLVGYEAV